MRTITAPQLAILASDHFNIHGKVEVQNVQGTWKEITNLEGHDWFYGAEWRFSLDTPLSGVLNLRRRVGSLSLAPLMRNSILNRLSDNSYSPIIYPGRRFRLSTACTPHTVVPVAGDWKEVVTGRLGEVQSGGRDDILSINFSDITQFLVNTFVEVEEPYGSEAGVALQTVIQQALDRWMGSGAYPLSTPVPPGWNLLRFALAQKSLWEGVRDLVLQMGWDIRFRYNALGQYVLTLYRPNREQVDPDYTFTPDMYTDIPNLSVKDDDVRNAIAVEYTNTAGQIVRTATATDPSSITEFGRRFMLLGLGATDNINTPTEADTLRLAALADLSRPPFDHEMVLPYWWPAEINDYYGFVANAEHYDTLEKFAVQEISHKLENGDGETRIKTRGKPASGTADWINRGTGAGSGLVSARASSDITSLGIIIRNIDGSVTVRVDANPETKSFRYAYSINGGGPTATQVEAGAVRTITGSDSFSIPGVTLRLGETIRVGVAGYTDVNGTDVISHSALDHSVIQYATDQAEIEAPNVEIRAWVPAGSVGTPRTDIHITVTDPMAPVSTTSLGTLRVWTNPTSTASRDPEVDVPDATVSIIVLGNQKSFQGPTNISALNDVRSDPRFEKRVFFEYISGTTGKSSGIVGFNIPGTKYHIDDGGRVTNFRYGAVTDEVPTNLAKKGVDGLSTLIGDELPLGSTINGRTKNTLQLAADRVAGTQLNDNPEFENNTVGYQIYDNSSGGHLSLSIETIANGTPNPAPNRTGKALRISVDSGAIFGVNVSPGWGGIVPIGFTVVPDGTPLVPRRYAKGSTILMRVMAWIPLGRRLSYHTNAIGSDSVIEALTPMDGTGTWETYIFRVKIGTIGSFSSTGHLALTNTSGGGTTGPFSWWIASYNWIDVSSAPSQFADTAVIERPSRKFTEGDQLDTDRRIINVKRGGITLPTSDIFRRGVDGLSDVLDSPTFRKTAADQIDLSDHKIINVKRGGITLPTSDLFRRGVDSFPDIAGQMGAGKVGWEQSTQNLIPNALFERNLEGWGPYANVSVDSLVLDNDAPADAPTMWSARVFRSGAVDGTTQHIGVVTPYTHSFGNDVRIAPNQKYAMGFWVKTNFTGVVHIALSGVVGHISNSFAVTNGVWMWVYAAGTSAPSADPSHAESMYIYSFPPAMSSVFLWATCPTLIRGEVPQRFAPSALLQGYVRDDKVATDRSMLHNTIVNTTSRKILRHLAANDGGIIAAQEAVEDAANLIYNGSFEVDADNDEFPDGWEVFQTTSSGGTVTRGTGGQLHGNYYLFVDPANGISGLGIACKPFSVREGNFYRLWSGVLNYSASILRGFYLRANWYTNPASFAAGNQFAETDVVTGDQDVLLAGPGAGWAIIAGGVKAPVGARWCRIVLFVWTQRNGEPLALDQVRCTDEGAYTGASLGVVNEEAKLNESVVGRQAGGIITKPLTKGLLSILVNNNNPVTWPTYQNPPVVRFPTVTVEENRARWGTQSQVDAQSGNTTAKPTNTYISPRPVMANKTASSGTPKLYLVSEGAAPTARSVAFSSPGPFNEGWSSGNATPNTAHVPSNNNTYSVSVMVSLDAPTGKSWSGQFTIYLQVQLDGGAWVTIDSWTQGFSLGIGANGFFEGTLEGVIEGLAGGNDNFRVLFDSITAGPIGATSECEIISNLTWLQDPGGLYASMTPSGVQQALQCELSAEG